MERGSVAIVGAAETTNIGVLPDISSLQLAAEAACNAMQNCDIGHKVIDGLATVNLDPTDVAFYLGIKPTWVDGTSVGGCAPLVHVRHAVAAIKAGLCKTVLITMGESGRSRNGGSLPGFAPYSLTGQFVSPFGVSNAATGFTLPVLRYMHEFGVSEEHLARMVVIQREWAALNPRAFRKEAITVEDVLNANMIVYPFRKPMICPLTDAGGALIVTAAERTDDFDSTPVFILGTGESIETFVAGIAQVDDPIRPQSVSISGQLAFNEAGISISDIDHLMLYDAFAHMPLLALEGLGFVRYGEAADFVSDGHTRVGGALPVNTNGGGLNYTHSGTYGMYAILESVRQLRKESAAQVANVRTSLVHGFGNLLSACATLILGNEKP